MIKARLVAPLRQALVAVAARLIYAALQLFIRLTPQKAAWLLQRFEHLAAPKNQVQQTPNPIAEIRELLETDPKGAQALRRILLENRKPQALSVIRGILLHYAIGQNGPLVSISYEKPQTGLNSSNLPLKIGIAGTDLDAKLLKNAYESLQASELIELADPDQQPNGITAIEITDGRWATDEKVKALIDSRIGISLHSSCIPSSAKLRQWLQLAANTGTPFRVFSPDIYYPPIQAVRKLIQGGQIGEVTTVRIRATLAGSGGKLEAKMPSPNDYLKHPAFDHFLLMAGLGGPLKSTASYLNPMDPKKGGQGLVNCRFAYDGRYGLLECTLAPQMVIRSEFYPYDLEAEIAGTDGTIWLTRGMAERTQEAPVLVRVGQQHFTIGVERGLPTGWESAHLEAAADFIKQLTGRSRPPLSSAEIVSAIGLRESAQQAAGLPGILPAG